MLELFREVLQTIYKNRVRTIYTGFSISWGLFILIVLLSAGFGLRNGVIENFKGESIQINTSI